MYKSNSTTVHIPGPFIYRNTESLCSDLSSITESPELCDVRFLVGVDRVPVYGVKSILGTRSRLLYSLILAQERANTKERKRLKKNRTVGEKLKSVIRKLTNSEKCLSQTETNKHLEIVLKAFDPMIFKKVMQHLMSGKVRVDVSSVIGVLEAAVQLGLGDLRDACFLFARRHIILSSVLPLFASIIQYGESKWTKRIKLEAAEFISQNSKTMLRHNTFLALPRKVALNVLQLPDLDASEGIKKLTVADWELAHPGEKLLTNDTSITSSAPVDFQVSITELIDQAELLQAVSSNITEQHTNAFPQLTSGKFSVKVRRSRSVTKRSHDQSKPAKQRNLTLTSRKKDVSLDKAFLCSFNEHIPL